MLESSFSKNNTGALRAIATLMVLFTHLNNTMSPRLENPFLTISLHGPLAIGLFFYFTGYNLIYSYNYRHESWSKNYWLKKIARIYIPFMLVNIFSRICWFAHGVSTSVRGIISCILGFHVLNPEFWYVQSVMLIYSLFYIVFMLYDKSLGKRLNTRLVPAVLCLAVWIAYSAVFSRFGGFDGKFAVRPWPLLLGMLVALYGCEVIKYWAKYKWEIFFLCAFVLIIIPQYTQYGLFLELPLIGRVDYVQLRMFVVCILANTLIIGEDIRSKFFAFVSKYSFYIYLCHAVFYVLYRSTPIYIKSDLLYLCAYLVSVFVFAVLLHKLANRLENSLIKFKNSAVRQKTGA